ncbi:hypothetical protein HK100_006062 [Physocladia obscura]|uniref:Glucanase n=1 Tax=Physocladia obscura TaxID=109957 RepID=A0AAD5SSZ0_9FUNG|nr:hypothetical protein HK100_006062 [Physocladia obscura]
MIAIKSLLTLASLGFVTAQNPGTIQAESHPSLVVSSCTVASGCTTATEQIVLDANWRWISNAQGTANCYDLPTYPTTNGWNPAICPQGNAATDATCAASCYIQGNSVSQYQSTYGVTTSGNSLKIGYVEGTNIGARVYLMDTSTTYQLFKLKNREFTFTVDVSTLVCGLNGALYFTNMDASGNLVGDAQCPHDIKFANGMANVEGTNGNCCMEFDVWEANKEATAFTSHSCAATGLYVCTTAAECGDGTDRAIGFCDKDGCDINPYRNGVTNFYGPGLTIDTTQPITVVTQFLTSDGTDTGTLSQVRRYWVQNGNIYQTLDATIAGLASYNTITDAYCTAERTAFSDTNPLQGGLAQLDSALTEGVVLSLSLWDDATAGMDWLDSSYPPGATVAGTLRGPCPFFNWTTGIPNLRSTYGSSASVTFSNIKFGELGSTFSGTTVTTSASTTTTTSTTRPTTTTTTTTKTTTTTTTTTTTSKPTTTTTITTTTTTKPTTTTTTTSAVPSTTSTTTTSCSAKWGQCGGIYWTGPTCCIASTCTAQTGNPYYSQCL